MARYPKSIKALRKGNAKKAESAREDLLTLLSDPMQEELRRLWWGPRSWQLILDGLQEAVADGPSFAGEVLSAYQAAWVATQEDWERWHEHFWQLRSLLKGWVAADGIVPVPVDLHAEKPGRELHLAEKRFRKIESERNRHRSRETSAERFRGILALELDHTLKFDVERGESFQVQDPNVTGVWPWDLRWPQEFEGRGEKGSGEPLLGTVVRLMNGCGTIRTGIKRSEEVSSPGAMIKRYRESLVIVCDSALLVLEWLDPMGGKETWGLVEAFPYHQIEIRDAKLLGPKWTVGAMIPGQKQPVWSIPDLPDIVLDSLREAKTHSGSV